MVGIGKPLKFIIDPGVKLIPMIIKLKPGLPAVIDVGDMLVIFGNGLLTVNVNVSGEVPPPNGLVIVTKYIPEGRRFIKDELTVICVAESTEKSAGCRYGGLLNATREPLAPCIKLFPAIIKFPVGLPQVDDVVEIDAIFGCGLFTVNVWEFEVPPPGDGLNTVTGYVPAVVILEEGTEAVSWFEETKTVVMADPLKLIVELDTKLVPLTVKLNPVPPAVADWGDMLVVVGTRLLA